MRQLQPLWAALCLLVALTAGHVAAARASAEHSLAAAVSAADTVTITNFQFAPGTITIKAGATVTWVNKEGTHTITADDGSWESPTLSAGQSFSQKFDKPGTYRYYCSFHGSKGGHDMAGAVRVTR